MRNASNKKKRMVPTLALPMVTAAIIACTVYLDYDLLQAPLEASREELRLLLGAANAPTPSANAKIIDAPYIYQGIDYPNGCESVSAVMALRYFGSDMTVDAFIDDYLDMGSPPEVGGIGPDPDLVYCGDPRSSSGWGCNSTVIARALNRLIDPAQYAVSALRGASLSELCSTYIDNDIPVIVWATVGMIDSSDADYYAHWTTEDGKPVSYNRKLHCLLLVGYDENHYYFNDPLRKNADGTSYTGYEKASAETAYNILNRQCVVIAPTG